MSIRSESCCSGHPSHAVSENEIICHACGTLVVGARLGVYVVQRLLGQGRSGTAYLATHLRTTQPVVLKLFPALDASTGLWEVARREVRVATALRHPAILPVYSSTYWQPDEPAGREQPPQATPRRATFLLTLCQYAPANIAHFVAQHESGQRQANIDQRRRLFSRLFGLLRQLGTALSIAHARGMVHGAIVPGNILLDERGHLWLSDFGLARLHPPQAPFLAPELLAPIQAAQHNGNIQGYWDAATPASDQYALASLCEQIFTRLLRATDYEPMLPVLKCASNEAPGRRFASIDIFMHELLSQASRVYHLSGSDWRSSSQWDSQETPLPHQASRPLGGSNPGANLMPVPATPTPVRLPQVEDWERRGDKLFTLHDYSGAVKAYQRALDGAPDKAATWLALGDSHFALEDYREALRAYERAMLLDPSDSQAWTNRGTALDALGRHKEAADCYDQAEQLR